MCQSVRRSFACSIDTVVKRWTIAVDHPPGKAPAARVARNETRPAIVDNCPFLRYKIANLAHLRNAFWRRSLNAERGAVPARGFANRSRAASGIIGPALRPVWEVRSLDWDWRARVTPV